MITQKPYWPAATGTEAEVKAFQELTKPPADVLEVSHKNEPEYIPPVATASKETATNIPEIIPSVSEKEGDNMAGKGGGASNHERHVFLETNKAAILADIRSMGQTKARKKWDIASSSWFYLMKRWGVTAAIARFSDTASAPASVIAEMAGKLPVKPKKNHGHKKPSVSRERMSKLIRDMAEGASPGQKDGMMLCARLVEVA
jgi:hypothetical protein